LKGATISIFEGLVLLDGIPLHPLIIHVTVVALPLAFLMVVLSLTWQRFRTYDFLTLGVLIVGSVSAFMASVSGRQLSESIGVSLEHATWGFYAPIASTVAAVFFGLLIWARKQNAGSLIAKITKGGFAVVVIASIGATLALTVLAGHSGAKLTWEPKVSWITETS
jgi:hypothetical protein